MIYSDIEKICLVKYFYLRNHRVMRNVFAICLLVLSCHSKTVLDIESCLNSVAAQAAVPILGEVAEALLGATTEAQASSLVLGLGVKYGVAAVTCALDTVVRDLGGDKTAPRTITQSVTPTAAQRAVFYGRKARVELVKSK